MLVKIDGGVRSDFPIWLGKGGSQAKVCLRAKCLVLGL